jgi:hypothetical protein
MRNTSPAAMMASQLKYVRSVWKLSPVKNEETLTAK